MLIDYCRIFPENNRLFHCIEGIGRGLGYILNPFHNTQKQNCVFGTHTICIFFELSKTYIYHAPPSPSSGLLRICLNSVCGVFFWKNNTTEVGVNSHPRRFDTFNFLF